MSPSSSESETGHPEAELPELTLETLPPYLREACERAGWKSLMPVQARSLPYIFDRRDLMVQSRTGSGKTGAFVLPILERVDPKLAQCQALILVPTRELAVQVGKEVETLSGGTVRSIAVYGGVGYGPQLDAFKAGAHVVVGTPGRVLDHLLRRSLTLHDLEILVFDEADRMMSMGFYPDMKQVQRYLPRHNFNSYMFSATFPPHVLRLAGEFLRDPELLSLSTDQVHVTDTEHVFYVAPALDKDRALIRMIEIENPSSAIIFCNTKVKVNFVTTVLQRFGYDADQLSADLAQGAREKVLGRVRDGKLRFLVATDVAARGIDIPELSHVFQFEPPEDPEAYIHRAGRTGRAGAAGEAVTIISAAERSELRSIAQRFKIDMQERPLPTDEDVADIVSQRVTALLEARLRDRDKLQVERLQRFLPLVRSLAENDDESALIAMLVDEYYQKSLHAPETPPAKPDFAPGSRSAERAAGSKSGGSGGPRGGRPSRDSGRSSDRPSESEGLRRGPRRKR